MKRKSRTIMGTPHSVNSPAPTQSSGEPVIPLPFDILEEIFLNLPPHQVVCVCRLVCRQWKDVADSECFWRERCRREGYRLHDASKVPSDWRLLYFLYKKRRNLLKNPRADAEFQGWVILENGGDMWKIEGLMVQHSNPEVQKNFVTSYRLCRKEQLINLEKEGYSPSFMDKFQPHIRISDWYAPRWDCGSTYVISVQLLNYKKKILQHFNPEPVVFPQWNDQQWHQMVHVFKDYGTGVRYIRFIHGGQDTQLWAGWYGIRVTESCVEIFPNFDTYQDDLFQMRRASMGETFSSKLPVCRNSPSSKSGWDSTEPTFNIPLDILEEIYLNLPAHLVVCVCRLVCHYWKDVADSESLWRERCRREGYAVRESSKSPSDWRLFYFMCKKRKNLIKNPRGEDELRGWRILRNGGDGWRIERPMAPHPNKEIQTNFVTSFHMCTKSQLIDLVEEGYSQALLDEVQPHIRVSDWYAPRCDCEYNMSVKLLHRNKSVSQEFSPGTLHLCEQDNQRWKQMIHVFKDYGPGVRYVYFEHGGKDSVYWAGWYGIRLTETSIELYPQLYEPNN
ncbi:uncharacterized protein FYW61_004397 [Anableps anableps]